MIGEYLLSDSLFRMLAAAIFFTAANFLSFFWSVIGIFSKSEASQIGAYRLLQLNSLGIWIYSLILLTKIADEILLLFLITAQFGSLILFWMQSSIAKKNRLTLAFSLDKPKALVQEGLYKFVRHPFYVIYLLCYYSLAIYLNNVFLWAMVLSMNYIYWRAARSEEAKFLNSELREEYLAYSKKVGRFFPKVFGAGK